MATGKANGDRCIPDGRLNGVAEQFARHEHHIINVGIGISLSGAPLPDPCAKYPTLVVVGGKLKFDVRHGHLRFGAT